MPREYHRWFSHQLGRDMELVTHGHAGPVMLVFPTSMGAFFEYEDRGMVAALGDKLALGLMRVACVSTVDSESFYANGIPPRARIDRYLAYERYLLQDVVPFLTHTTGQAPLGVTGCSFGAYHALAMALRHPDVFTSCVTMGGAYDITRFLDGYYDTDAYLLCPPHFLPGLADPWFLDRINRNKFVFITGESDICRADNEQIAALFAQKGIPHSLHIWSHGSEHDWPEWRKMAQAYLP
jgi:esterase/lipase superfamily enzyme